MPAWPTCAGFDFVPRSPWKIRSPGSRFTGLRIRCAGGTSPDISNVVRPWSTDASADAPGNGSSLKTRQTKPEQSKPPGAGLPNGCCASSDVPPQMYG